MVKIRVNKDTAKNNEVLGRPWKARADYRFGPTRTYSFLEPQTEAKIRTRQPITISKVRFYHWSYTKFYFICAFSRFPTTTMMFLSGFRYRFLLDPSGSAKGKSIDIFKVFEAFRTSKQIRSDPNFTQAFNNLG